MASTARLGRLDPTHVHPGLPRTRDATAARFIEPPRVRQRPLVCPARMEWPIKRGAQGALMMSQCGQDMFLDTTFFRGARGGVYLDLGCNDGRSNSNTFYFARALKWYGKCYEADPNKFQQIPRFSGRNDAEHGAISRTDGSAEFGIVNVADGGLSGLADTLDAARGHEFGRIRTVTVPTVSPSTVLRRHYAQNSTIDYVSVDVEGHELEVIRAWPFRSGPCISVFTIENNHWCNLTQGILPQLQHLMPDYRHLRSVGPDEIFVRRKRCPGSVISPSVWRQTQPLEDVTG